MASLMMGVEGFASSSSGGCVILLPRYMTVLIFQSAGKIDTGRTIGDRFGGRGWF